MLLVDTRKRLLSCGQTVPMILFPIVVRGLGTTMVSLRPFRRLPARLTSKMMASFLALVHTRTPLDRRLSILARGVRLKRHATRMCHLVRGVQHMSILQALQRIYHLVQEVRPMSILQALQRMCRLVREARLMSILQALQRMCHPALEV